MVERDAGYDGAGAEEAELRRLRAELAEERASSASLRAQLAALTEQMGALARAMGEHAAAITRMPAQRALAGAPASSITIEELFEAFRVDHELPKGHPKERTWINQRNRLRPLLRRHGDMPAIELTPKRWAAHARARRQEPLDRGAPHKRIAESTLDLELAYAKALLNWGAEDEQQLLPYNPLEKAHRTRKPPQQTWYTEPQIQQLLGAPEPRSQYARATVRAFLLNKADTGCRFNEVRHFRADRVREHEGQKLIDVGRTKNGRVHFVALTARGWEALRDLKSVCDSVSRWFFASYRTGNLLAEVTIRRWLGDAARSTGIDAYSAEGEHFRPHHLRRSAATNAHNRGASLLDVQEMLNHRSPAVTAQYVQRSATNAVRIARLMEDGAAREREAEKKNDLAKEKDVQPENATLTKP